MTSSVTTRPAPGIDLEAQLDRLDAVVDDLGDAPADRDAVLWAAHELATCARMLIGTRRPESGPDSDLYSSSEGGTDATLAAAADYARSAMASLIIARRQELSAN